MLQILLFNYSFRVYTSIQFVRVIALLGALMACCSCTKTYYVISMRFGQVYLVLLQMQLAKEVLLDYVELRLAFDTTQQCMNDSMVIHVKKMDG